MIEVLASVVARDEAGARGVAGAGVLGETQALGVEGVGGGLEVEAVRGSGGAEAEAFVDVVVGGESALADVDEALGCVLGGGEPQVTCGVDAAVGGLATAVAGG